MFGSFCLLHTIMFNLNVENISSISISAVYRSFSDVAIKTIISSASHIIDIRIPLIITPLLFSFIS